MGLFKSQRWRQVAAIGVTLVVVAYVARRAFDHDLDADVWYSMSTSSRQELTEIVLRRVTDDVRYENEARIVYVVLDPTVDWEKAVTAIARPLRGVLKRAAYGEIPIGALGIGIAVTPFNRKRAFVFTSWSPGKESMMFTLERKWWRWKIVEENVTTAI